MEKGDTDGNSAIDGMDREQTLRFLEMESALNLFLIGDIYNYGFDQEFQQLWGDFDGTGQLRAVLLRYRGNWIPWAPGPFDVEGFAEVIRTGRETEMLSGIDRVTGAFRRISRFALSLGQPAADSFCPLHRRRRAEPAGERSFPAHPAHDLGRCAGPFPRLSEQIAEFDSRARAEEFGHLWNSGDARGYWAEDGGPGGGHGPDCGGKSRVGDGGGRGHPPFIPSAGTGHPADDPIVPGSVE